MLYSSIGYYALIFGLAASFLIFFFSIKNLRNKEILDIKIVNFTNFILIYITIQKTHFKHVKKPYLSVSITGVKLSVLLTAIFSIRFVN